MDITDPVVWGSALSILFMVVMMVYLAIKAKKNMDRDSKNH
jgi:hypothetical protein